MSGGAILTGLLLLGSGPASVDAGTVAQAIADRRSRVAEFQVIRESARELGVRVWLFGGTAAGYAHYVRWDLAREGGDTRYRAGFFDYDFTNIYRSTQDADLVVDALPQQAEQLENLIKQKMSFVQGSKKHWEVRLLRHSRTVGRQVKVPLLANPDFLEQNTDSNSTGMIELTDPPRGEEVVRDLRDWASPEPFFLKDITAGRLHYYRSPTHQRTSRYLSGDNPELFSVIRFLVKAFQYDLTVDGEDLAQVQAIVDAFQPTRDYPPLSRWAQGWLERYAPNLIRHSVNIEYAWNTLEGLGLRRKLVSLSDRSREGSLGWWLSREPLRTRPVGLGHGLTAAQLGIEVVAHETQDFLAYESITRDTTLRPNVLISRRGQVGETAAAGDGFYTRQGRVGARGTGLTVRFQVDPQAREGADFTRHGDFVLFTNRAALQVIPETVSVSMTEYFELLRVGLVDPNDRGAWMKLQRRLARLPLAAGEEERLVQMVSKEICRVSAGARFSGTGAANSLLLREWFALPVSRAHPELLEDLLANDEEEFAGEILGLPGWSGEKEVIQNLLRRGVGLAAVARLLLDPRWAGEAGLVVELAYRVAQSDWRSNPPDLTELLDQPQWRNDPFLRQLCGGYAPDEDCLGRVAVVHVGDDLEDLAGRERRSCP